MTFNIDVLEELEPYMDRFNKKKTVDEKLLACSPFRADTRPSFVVFLDKGNWVDSGNSENRSGTFYELLSHLSGDTEEDIKHYLGNKYGALQDIDALKIEMKLNMNQPKKIFTKEELQLFMFRHSYLAERGISEKVQRAFKVGYDKDFQAVMIPWTDTKGNVVKMKFRSVKAKKFWYSKEGQRIKEHVFGLHFIKKHSFKKVYIVESEIDCMYLWTHGIPAIATGTAHISEAQIKLVRRSPIETLVIASDNDQAGQIFKEQLAQVFGGVMELKEVVFPKDTKDINELSTEQMSVLVERDMRSVFIQ